MLHVWQQALVLHIFRLERVVELIFFVSVAQGLHRFFVLLWARRQDTRSENPLTKVADVGHKKVDLVKHSGPLFSLMIPCEWRWPIEATFTSLRAPVRKRLSSWLGSLSLLIIRLDVLTESVALSVHFLFLIWLLLPLWLWCLSSHQSIYEIESESSRLLISLRASFTISLLLLCAILVKGFRQFRVKHLAWGVLIIDMRWVCWGDQKAVYTSTNFLACLYPKTNRLLSIRNLGNDLACLDSFRPLFALLLIF